MNYMRSTGISYPKACEECGLGPCRYPQHQGQPVAEIKHTYYTAAELDMIRKSGGPPPPGAVGNPATSANFRLRMEPGGIAHVDRIPRVVTQSPRDGLPDALSQTPLKKWQPRVVHMASAHGNLHVLYDDGELWMKCSVGTWRRLDLPR